MKQIIIFSFLLIAIFAAYPLFSQIELSNFNATGRAGLSTSLATDYQCLGINPANLAFPPTFERRQHTLGFAELGFSAYTDALTRETFVDALKNPNKKFTYSEKIEAARRFANSDLSLNLDFLLLGYGWQAQDGGSGFGFNVRERIQWFSRFNPLTSDILFKGYNAETYFDIVTNVRDTVGGRVIIDTLGGIAKISKRLSEILDDSRISLSWMREFNAGYGAALINDDKLRLNIGIGGRFTQGIGVMDVRADKGKLEAFIAASPGFNINFKDDDNPSPSRDTANVGFIPNTVGNGMGFDLGFSAELGGSLKLGISLVNIGTVNYRVNVYTASDTFLSDLKSKGFDNYNFFRQAEQFDGFQKDMIKWQGLKSIRKNNPAMLRAGGSYQLADVMLVGSEFVIPLDKNPGNLITPAISVGVEFIPFNWIRVSTGLLRGGNFVGRTAMPLGVTFSPLYGRYECGISTRDILSYFVDNQPIISSSFGFLRFRF